MCRLRGEERESSLLWTECEHLPVLLRNKEGIANSLCRGGEYLKKGQDDPLSREIEKKISSDLQAETADVFEMDEVAAFAMVLEKFFVDHFYADPEAQDNHIYEGLTKIYAIRKGIAPESEGENKSEASILKKYHDVDKRFANLSDELKTRAILRMIKSIRSSSGSVLGNRNYLEMIYSQHTGKGKWAALFQKLESKR